MLATLRKYVVVSRQNFIDAITHRNELLLWILLDSFPTIVIFFVWSSIFAGHTEINGYTLASTVQYSFLLLLINHMITAHFEAHYATVIRQGKIDLYFTRPLSFLSYLFWIHLSKKIFYVAIVLSFSLLLATTLFASVGMTLHWPTFAQTLQLIPLISFGFFIEFLMSLICVLLVFWFEGANSLEHFKWLITWLFSGAIIPRAFAPPWIASITNALPFKYMYAVPIEVYQGRTTLTTTDVAVMTLTLISLIIFSRKLWDAARKQYTSAGG